MTNEVTEENGSTTYYFPGNTKKATLGQRIRLFFSIYWKSILIVLTPLVLLPLPIIYNTKAFRCAYIVLIMATYWVLELLPLPVTSMLPIVLFPTMGILDSKRTCAAYMKETNMMFMGGLMIAAGVQHSRLPKRIALLTVQFVGCSHRRLNFGLTFVTWFISMWVSNAAATTMMVPIVEAILEVLEQAGIAAAAGDIVLITRCYLQSALMDLPLLSIRQVEQGLGDVYINKKKNALAENGKEVKPAKGAAAVEEEVPIPSNITICHYLSIAYASTLGGCSTFVGTATNSAFKGIFDSEFPDIDLNFFWFMVYSIPTMLIIQLLVWLSLQITFMGMFRPNSEHAKSVNLGTTGTATTMKVIKEQYKNLGPVTFHETSAGILFLLAVGLYIFRSPGFITGWAKALTDLEVKDGVTSMFIVVCMFMLPMTVDFVKFFSSKYTYEELANTKASPSVVTWKILKEKIPWGLLFLLGGGFALAEGSKESGLSAMIGGSLNGLQGQSPLLVLFVVVVVTQFITEFTSNVAIANLILPVLANMARTLGMDPRFLMVPATLACSMAFHLPVGTPPNAIVAGVASIPTSRMAVGGIGPKILTTLIVWGAYPIWGAVIFPPAIASIGSKVNSAILPLACNTTTSAILQGHKDFNCTLPSSFSKTANATLLKGVFSCDFSPFNSTKV